MSLCQLFNVPRLFCMSKIINENEVRHFLAFSPYKPTKSTRKNSLCPHRHTYTDYMLKVERMWKWVKIGCCDISWRTEFKCFPLSLFPGSDEDTDMASDFPLKEWLVLLSIQYTLISKKITAVSQAAEIAKIWVMDLPILSVQTGRGLNDRF